MLVITKTRLVTPVSHAVIIATDTEADRDAVLAAADFERDDIYTHIFHRDRAEFVVKVQPTLAQRVWREGLCAAAGLLAGLAVGLLLAEPRAGAVGGVIAALVASALQRAREW